tara:strand:- start:106 stop:1323 length:1218 start_codon:yes stop_codon:yes gene_type:complete
MKKVAITLSRKAIKYNRLFTNGIHQNIYTLQKILTKTGLYDVSLVYDYTAHTEPFEDGTYAWKIGSKEHQQDLALLEEEKKQFHKFYPHFDINKVYHRSLTTTEEGNVLEDFDLVIEAGYCYDLPNIKKIRKANPNIKIAFLAYGNMYFGALEKLVFPSLGATIPYNEGRDAVWMSPHFEDWLEWHKTLLHTPIAAVAPYVWSPDFFEKKINKLSLTRETFSTPDNNSIAVLEPNIGFVKSCLTPIVTIENLYNRNPDLIDAAYILNADKLMKTEAAKSMFTKLNVVQTGVMSFEKRYGLAQMFNKNARVLLSHQHCCALNYVYLEALYLGIPLVHNSAFFKEAGYYYEGFDINSASLQLEKALENKNSDNPNGDRAEDYIWQYSPENPDNIDGYIRLIEEVLTK